jgi:hypothetical protein
MSYRGGRTGSWRAGISDHIDFAYRPLGIGQIHRFESVLKNRCGLPRFKTSPRGIRR